jgi:hypothetical protein
VIGTDEVLPVAEACRRLTVDHEVLVSLVDGRDEVAARAAFTVAGGPLGDFCESLHDLLAHVLMWDEINLAVLTEAGAGRTHWSLDPRWEAAEIGRALNRGGVAAGRLLPTGLLRHRYGAVHAALLAELGALEGDRWPELGPTTQYVFTVPGQQPYWHAALHLNRLPHQHPGEAQP